MYAISRLLLIALVALLGLASDTHADDWSADSGFSIKSQDDLDVDEGAGGKWFHSPFPWRASNRPSPLRQLGTSTKRFFARTRDWFSFAPKSDAIESDEGPGFPGWNRAGTGFGSEESEPEAASGGLFGSLFRRREPTKLELPHKWIALDRPEP